MQIPRPNSNENMLDGVAQLADLLEKIINGTLASGVNADKLDGIDSLGFLQLAVAANRKLGFGGGAIALAAATTGNVNVTHGLGFTPLRVICQLLQSSVAFAWLAVGAYGATTFNVSCQTNAAVTGNINFDWFAIG